MNRDASSGNTCTFSAAVAESFDDGDGDDYEDDDELEDDGDAFDDDEDDDDGGWRTLEND